jgi:lipid-A-disaccharide synthase
MIWAWRRGRVKTIARLVDRMLCILPFEEDFYREAGVSARYVGSPVVEQVPSPASAASFRQKLGLSVETPTLALLPGSRMSEIRRILPSMVGAAKQLVAERPGLQVVGASDAAIVASGTAALEAGLMQRPLVVVYRVSLVTYLVGRMMLKVAHVALVNLLAGRRVVPELLQGDMTPERIAGEIRRLWVPGTPRDEMLQGLEEVRTRLGQHGAAARAAESVLELLPPAQKV